MSSWSARAKGLALLALLSIARCCVDVAPVEAQPVAHATPPPRSERGR
jgi:hypothetical protein